jgi:hypothetical protein
MKDQAAAAAAAAAIAFQMGETRGPRVVGTILLIVVVLYLVGALR